MKNIERLVEIMRRLRDPMNGCPWDREQNFATIAPYTIEEAYEVADAIERNDLPGLQDELGDLLFQVVFHSQLASELDAFDLDAVAQTICAKMERRHPHVFGDATITSATAQTVAWEAHKRSERAAASPDTSALAGVAAALPALLRATKLGKRAAQVGFDWPEVRGVLEKVREEIAELEEALAAGSPDAMQEELGDLLFTVANLSRHLKVDAESALRAANAKFERRFRHLERQLREQGHTVEQCSPATLDQLWGEAKRAVG
jgi:MazG family protein